MLSGGGSSVIVEGRIMNVPTINILLEGQAAEIYRHVSVEQQESLRRLINLVVQEFVKYSPQSLLAVMDTMSREAQAKGLTPEILASLLADE